MKEPKLFFGRYLRLSGWLTMPGAIAFGAVGKVVWWAIWGFLARAAILVASA
jgi:hypothetical protein